MKLALARNQERASTPGARLRQARTTAGLSAYVLAKELGISRQALSQMELDQIEIPPAKINRIAHLLSTTPQWLRFAAGLAPRWPEVPLMIPEMDLDREAFDLRLRDAPEDDNVWLQYRTQKEWAIPSSEVQRVGAFRDKLIAIEVKETLPPEFKRGDIVIVDRAANSFRQDGYYAATIAKECKVVGLKRADDGAFLVLARDEPPERMSYRSVRIIGAVIGLGWRRRTNFSF